MARRRPVAGVPAHLRAALVLRGYTAQEFADGLPPELRISARTLARILTGERAAEEWEVRAFAEALAVPEWFLREGVDSQTDGPGGAERDELRDLLARQHDEVIGRLDQVAEDLRLLRAGRSGLPQ